MSVNRRSLLAVAVGAALALSGCAPQQPDLAPRAAQHLQEGVAEIARAAAQGRYDAAAQAVEQVRARLEEAAEANEISVARYAEIDAALSRTEAELSAAAEALRTAGEDETPESTPEPEPAPEPEPEPVPAPVERPEPDPAPAPQAPSGGGSQDSGGPEGDPPSGKGENRGRGRGGD